jgi:chorismate-pyruvate lyase
MRLVVPTGLLYIAAVLVPLWAHPCRAQGAPAQTTSTPTHSPLWHDTPTARLEALALLQTLDADLLSHDSATLTLEQWCGAHQMASPPHVVADRMPDVDKPPTALQRQDLDVTATEPIRYRRVQLRCGNHVLSVAENWYVPGRLTPDMNRLLETTDVGFGRVVRPLHFWRHTLETKLLWSPLPAGWESANRRMPARLVPWPDPQSEVLQHRAVLVLPDGRPISEVVETYTAEVLAFSEPQLER